MIPLCDRCNREIRPELQTWRVTPNGYEHEWCPNPTVKRFCEPSYPE